MTEYGEADSFLSFCFILQAYICTVALLVELGAKINVQQDTGETALMKVRPMDTSLLHFFSFLISLIKYIIGRRHCNYRIYRNHMLIIKCFVCRL